MSIRQHLLAASSPPAFSPVLHVYVSGVSQTETIPAGATQVIIEVWGGGGGGGANDTTSIPGGGGAAGAYSRCTLLVANIGGTGKTFTYTVGAAGAGSSGGNGGNGGNSSVLAGTVTGFSSISCTGGQGGLLDATSSVSGGSASNANSGAVNTNGAGVAAGNKFGATGTSGTVGGDGSPNGGGGAGHGQATLGDGSAGQTGTVVFSYT